MKKVAILTAGGDCPGLNAVIRGITKTCIEKYGIEVDGAVVHGGAVEIRLDNFVGLLVGIGQVAHGGIVGAVRRAEGEGLGGFITGLEFHFGKINAPAVDSGRGAGFEPPQRQTQSSQIGGKAFGRVHAVGAGLDDTLAGDDGAVQVGAGGNDDSFCAVLRTQLGAHTHGGAVLHQNFGDLGLLQL